MLSLTNREGDKNGGAIYLELFDLVVDPNKLARTVCAIMFIFF